MGNRHKIAQYLTQAQEAGIKILPPDIENSKADFSLENGKILVGLKAIRGLRSDLLRQILEIKRPIKSMTDFLWKIDNNLLSADAVGNLIKAGTFDRLAPNRNELLKINKDLVESVKMAGSNLSLFETLEPKVEEEKCQLQLKNQRWKLKRWALVLALIRLLRFKNMLESLMQNDYKFLRVMSKELQLES